MRVLPRHGEERSLEPLRLFNGDSLYGDGEHPRRGIELTNLDGLVRVAWVVKDGHPREPRDQFLEHL